MKYKILIFIDEIISFIQKKTGDENYINQLPE